MTYDDLTWAAHAYEDGGYGLAFEVAFQSPLRNAAMGDPGQVDADVIREWVMPFWSGMHANVRNLHAEVVAAHWAEVVGIVDAPDLANAVDHIADLTVQMAAGRVRRLGSVAVAKLLGMIYPSRFVMWDNDIAWHYGFAANGRGYAMFSVKMAAMRTEIAAEGGFGADEIDHHFQGLYGPSKTAFKLMDEFNWMTITRHIQPGA